MSQPDLTQHFLELVRRTSTDLRPDVEEALRAARERESAGSAAQGALDTILKNVELAREKSTPICQDTGTPIFYVYYPEGWSTRKLSQQIQDAVALATAKAYLRPNAVDSLTGRNSGNNLGEEFPSIHFQEWGEPYLQVDLMLKGGGCENVGAQYKLPDTKLGAGRNLDGVRRAVLDAVHQAQGKGCSPGIIGVAVGGDRGTGYVKSKEQFFRDLDDTNTNPELAALEARLNDEANSLGIGPMGFGGATTVLGVKVGAAHRLPASFFVTASYMCWADRRRTMTWRDGQVEIN
jgi:fumarate hydratase class I